MLRFLAIAVAVSVASCAAPHDGRQIPSDEVQDSVLAVGDVGTWLGRPGEYGGGGGNPMTPQYTSRGTLVEQPDDVAFSASGVGYVVLYSHVVAVTANEVESVTFGDPITGLTQAYTKGLRGVYALPDDDDALLLPHAGHMAELDLASRTLTTWPSSEEDAPVQAVMPEGEPYGIAGTREGGLFFSVGLGYESTVRELTPDGLVTLRAGSLELGYGFNGYEGPATELQLHLARLDNTQFAPGGRVALDEEHDLLYIADAGNALVRRVDLQSGWMDTVVGSGETAGALLEPVDLGLGRDGELYILDHGASCVLVLHPDGELEAWAGSCGEEGLTPDATGRENVLFDHPRALEVGPDGNVYVADSLNNVVWVIRTPSGDPVVLP